MKVFGNEVTFDADLIGPWVSSKTGGHWTKGRGTAVGRLKDGQLIGGVLYEDYTKANVVCHIAGDEGWATKGFLRLIFDYPFNQLGVKRITAPVPPKVPPPKTGRPAVAIPIPNNPFIMPLLLA